jgi:nucleotide-binding universal stress UspA family protein
MASIPWPAGTQVYVLAVVPERLPLLGIRPETQKMVAEMMAGTLQQERTTAASLIARVADQLRTDRVTVQAQVCDGRPAQTILEEAAILSADLIVVGAKGLSAPDEFRLGATAHKLVHYAGCSVLVVRAPTRPGVLSVILATDGSPEALRAAHFLCALSLPDRAEVTVISVAEDRDITVQGTDADERQIATDVEQALRQVFLAAGQRHADQAVQRLRDCGLQVRGASRIGYPAPEILRTAQDQAADLIVLGARGQTRGGPFRVGAVAQKVVKYATCSVLLVR